MNYWDYGLDLQNAYNDGFDDGIKQATPKWIPCSERLPENEEEVFVYLFGDSPYLAWVDKYGTWYTDSFALTKEDEKPVAWMPLPEPYRKED